VSYRLAELEHRWPAVEWSEPVPIQVASGATGLGCRVCIANDGVKAKDVTKLPQTREQWDEHFRTHLDG
jgi:hypothetical protein